MAVGCRGKRAEEEEKGGEKESCSGCLEVTRHAAQDGPELW